MAKPLTDLVKNAVARKPGATAVDVTLLVQTHRPEASHEAVRTILFYLAGEGEIRPKDGPPVRYFPAK